LSKDYRYVKNEINKIVRYANQENVEVKVIIKIGFLTNEKKLIATKLIVESGATFVKTCTLFGLEKHCA
jgi:deoxyribose-phosphate aldolase